MMKYWADLDPREKLLVSIAIGIVGILLAWQFLVKPIANYPQARKKAYESARSDLKFMQASEPILAIPATGAKQSISPGQLQSIVTKVAAEKKLPISRRQPKGDDELTLWLEDILSVNFYDWTRELTENYNIVLERASINRNEDGTIRVQVTFKRGE